MKTTLTLLFTLLSMTTMAKQKSIRTEIIINATPMQVWQVMTDFDQYRTWNPFIQYIHGNVAVGNKIKVKLDGMVFKPHVLVYQPNTEFKWIGKLGFKGLFDGEHRFELIDNGDGTTTFIQSEKFNGLLVGLFSKKLDKDIVPSFEAMNRKLKERVEGLNY